MSETVIRAPKVRVRHAPSSGSVQFVFSGAGGSTATIETNAADAPRLVLAMEAQLKQAGVRSPDAARVMTITNLSASIAEDGRPVLTIETEKLAGLSFAISPDQVEGVSAWLEKCHAALQGRNPPTQ